MGQLWCNTGVREKSPRLQMHSVILWTGPSFVNARHCSCEQCGTWYILCTLNSTLLFCRGARTHPFLLSFYYTSPCISFVFACRASFFLSLLLRFAGRYLLDMRFLDCCASSIPFVVAPYNGGSRCLGHGFWQLIIPLINVLICTKPCPKKQVKWVCFVQIARFSGQLSPL